MYKKRSIVKAINIAFSGKPHFLGFAYKYALLLSPFNTPPFLKKGGHIKRVAPSMATSSGPLGYISLNLMPIKCSALNMGGPPFKLGSLNMEGSYFPSPPLGVDENKLITIDYPLESFHRSNQDTSLLHKPAVFEGQWVESGDLIADCSTSVGGDLSLGQNILIGYMPWEGYNFEDAILISERLVYDDLYTSIHIEKYKIDIRETKLGIEQLTREIPDLEQKELEHLDFNGIAKLGSWVEQGDILVGKVTPIQKKEESPYQKLLYTILDKKFVPVRDSSLRAPKGTKAKVIDLQFFRTHHYLKEALPLKGVSGGQAISPPYTEHHPGVANTLVVEGLSKFGADNSNTVEDLGPLKRTPQKKPLPINPAGLNYSLEGKTLNRPLGRSFKQVLLKGALWAEPTRQPRLIKGLPRNALRRKIEPIRVNSGSPNRKFYSTFPVFMGVKDKPFFNNQGLYLKRDLNFKKTTHTPVAFKSDPLNFKRGHQGPLIKKGPSPKAPQGRTLKGLKLKGSFKKWPKKKKSFINQINNANLLIDINKGLLDIADQSTSLLWAKPGLYLKWGKGVIRQPLKKKSQIQNNLLKLYWKQKFTSKFISVENNFEYGFQPLLKPAMEEKKFHLGALWEDPTRQPLPRANSLPLVIFDFIAKAMHPSYFKAPFKPLFLRRAPLRPLRAEPLRVLLPQGGLGAGSFSEKKAPLLRALPLRALVRASDPDLKGWPDLISHSPKSNKRKVAKTILKSIYPIYKSKIENLKLHPPNALKKKDRALMVVPSYKTRVHSFSWGLPRSKGGAYLNFTQTNFVKFRYRKNLNRNYSMGSAQTVGFNTEIKGPPHKRVSFKGALPPLTNKKNSPMPFRAGNTPPRNEDVPLTPLYPPPFLIRGGGGMGLGVSRALTGLGGAPGFTARGNRPLGRSLKNGGGYISLWRSMLKVDSRRAINRIFFLKNKQKNNWHNCSPNSIRSIHIYLADKRKVQIGDKMSGRHGNKGIVSQILPREDMPYLPDGTPLDMVLNPLGVPSRMNVGQIYECLLGFAGKYLGEKFRILPFDEIYGPEASRSFVYSKLYEARVKTGCDWIYDPNNPGKMRLYDGRTGDCFDQKVTVGHSYILRLVHMVDDKIHARSTGPYSLVTQQPLRGRSKQGGQRLGEMEVWALEGYGAAFTLLEMLTIKSDDMAGRMTLWSNLLLEKDLSIGTPESFKVLICELQALCLDIGLFRPNPLKNYRLEKIENLMNLR